jgi:hypothetical protein
MMASELVCGDYKLQWDEIVLPATMSALKHMGSYYTSFLVLSSLRQLSIHSFIIPSSSPLYQNASISTDLFIDVAKTSLRPQTYERLTKYSQTTIMSSKIKIPIVSISNAVKFQTCCSC